MDQRLRPGMSARGQLCGGAHPGRPNRSAAAQAAVAALARALPLQERHSPGRDVLFHRARALAACAPAQSLPLHRAAPAPARRGGLARHTDRHGMKVALITGASSGIGAATARELAKRGWRVAVNYAHDKARPEAVAAECKGIAVQADVSRDADCRRLARTVLDEWHTIDALVNN